MAEEREKKRHTGICCDCEGLLELIELDMQKGTKIMRCQSCSLFHFYKKDFLSGYKLTKVSKEIS